MTRIGPYVVVRELGRGAMGVVYEALDERTGGRVALKVLLAAAANVEEVRRFEREAQVLGALDHPSIVRVVGSGVHEKRPFIALELVHGSTLRELFRQGPLPEQEVARIGRDLASALAHAHERGIIHRDVKPGNVLLSKGQPRLTDFGLSRALDGRTRLTATGDVLGTPNYMAPEQATDAVNAGPAADIYSLGVVLYEALAGRLPFQAASVMEVLKLVLRSAPDPIARHRPSVDPELARIVEGLLAKDPAQREPRDAAALAARLDEWLAAHGPDAKARGPSRLALVLGALVAASILFLAVAFVVAGRRARPTPAAPSAPPPPTGVRPVAPPGAPPSNAPPRTLATIAEIDSAFARCELEHALELLDARLAAQPDVTAWRTRGDLLLRRHDLAGARAAYEKVLALSPEDGLAELGVARARSELLANDVERSAVRHHLSRAVQFLHGSPEGKAAGRALAVLDDPDEFLARFALVLAGPDRTVDLGEVGFLVGALTGTDDETTAGARARLDTLGARFREALVRAGDAKGRLAIQTLCKFLPEQGYGSCMSGDCYADPRSSSLAWVLARKEGIPSTLGLLTMEVALRADLRVAFVCRPGSVIVRFDDDDGSYVLFDPYFAFTEVPSDIPATSQDHSVAAAPPPRVACRLILFLQNKYFAAGDLTRGSRCGRWAAALAEPGERDELVRNSF